MRVLPRWKLDSIIRCILDEEISDMKVRQIVVIAESDDDLVVSSSSDSCEETMGLLERAINRVQDTDNTTDYGEEVEDND